ncbi:MAG: peptide ABC transporter permease [Bdellovibrionales bacterium CG10_big_fil_rev_8_21_14_0_10_45_34]|nr:MAG: peptide ABC transporter permease [Bdellovibrionales bacterium CG10_big_fil_rev_8_21_14_0_10_45_34]
MCLIAIFAPFIATHDPRSISLPDQFQNPNSSHLFGTDQNGSDVFSRVVYGARISLIVSLSVVLISATVGTFLGSLAGYFGGWVDTLLMRFIDMLYAFPGFLLALSIVAFLGPSIGNLILALCITGWTGYARLVRGEALHLKTRDFVTASRAVGAGSFRLVGIHILPNLVGPLVVQMTFGMAGTLIAESSLSFLGLGAPPTEPTWGGLLNVGRVYLVEAPHLSFFPGVMIVMVVLSFNLFGDGLRDYLDPK